MSDQPTSGNALPRRDARLTLRGRLASEAALTPFWVLLAFTALTAYWLVRSVVRAGTSLDALHHWEWGEIALYGIGLAVFLMLTIAKIGSRRR
jgi:hypothetical protein